MPRHKLAAATAKAVAAVEKMETLMSQLFAIKQQIIAAKKEAVAGLDAMREAGAVKEGWYEHWTNNIDYVDFHVNVV